MTFGPRAPLENKEQTGAFEVLNFVDGQPSRALGIAFSKLRPCKPAIFRFAGRAWSWSAIPELPAVSFAGTSQFYSKSCLVHSL
jgi:hypothetical protein